jgi:hypothetical protein
MELLCGHFTHKEEIELNSVWQPAKDVFYCDKCKFWTMKKPPPPRQELPDEPPF